MQLFITILYAMHSTFRLTLVVINVVFVSCLVVIVKLCGTVLLVICVCVIQAKRMTVSQNIMLGTIFFRHPHHRKLSHLVSGLSHFVYIFPSPLCTVVFHAIFPLTTMHLCFSYSLICSPKGERDLSIYTTNYLPPKGERYLSTDPTSPLPPSQGRTRSIHLHYELSPSQG